MAQREKVCSASNNSTMSKQLLDQNKRIIPICNVRDEEKEAHFYVSDPNTFLTSKKELHTTRMFTFAATFVFILLLSIFTLNLNAGEWSAGNILTFGIIIVTLYALVTYSKQWIVTSTSLTEMIKNGNPCKIEESENNVVYCNRN